MNRYQETPLLSKEGRLRPSRKCREASLAGADGVVARRRRRESTTPSALLKEASRYFLEVASTPPWKGGDFATADFAVPLSLLHATSTSSGHRYGQFAVSTFGDRAQVSGQ